MTERRHRQAAFPSPFSPEELQLDPEKRLWVPGRKTIFLPAITPAPAPIDWATIVRQANLALDRFNNWRDWAILPLNAGYYAVGYNGICECVPSRHGFLADSNRYQRQRPIILDRSNFDD